ncbi:MAG: ribosomal L7Ae/L30e/S12e/Gadd45 family protein [Eubacteriales bacterium]|jgi:ribosomal protein L7Ae-like RNA K-turn-binding protein|nr:ribosomal L7Ae/L30e/S12e/Gadd45 family protein [Eubacteriales bacterium]
MKKKKIDSYLGFARKAGKLSAGTDTCMNLGKQGKLKLLIITEDMAGGSAEKLERMAASEKIPYRRYGEADHIARMTGWPGRAVFGVTEDGFASVIAEAIDEELRREKEVLV